MEPVHPGLPQPGEYSPFAAVYIAKAQAFADPIQKLADQLDEVLALLRPMDAGRQAHRYAPGKWSIKEVLGHVIDTERIFAYRALRVARADQTPLPAFDEKTYAAAAETERYDWGELLEEFEHVRKASILLLRHLPEAAWMRMGTASEAPISVRALAYMLIGHVEHHLEILRTRYL
jgi:uncharacterized damage-inducible protein DinB